MSSLKTDLVTDTIVFKVTKNTREAMEQRARELNLPGPEVYRLAVAMFLQFGLVYGPPQGQAAHLPHYERRDHEPA